MFWGTNNCTPLQPANHEVRPALVHRIDFWPGAMSQPVRSIRALRQRVRGHSGLTLLCCMRWLVCCFDRMCREVSLDVRLPIPYEFFDLKEAWSAPLSAGAAQIGNGEAIKLLHLPFIKNFCRIH